MSKDAPFRCLLPDAGIFVGILGKRKYVAVNKAMARTAGNMTHAFRSLIQEEQKKVQPPRPVLSD